MSDSGDRAMKTLLVSSVYSRNSSFTNSSNYFNIFEKVLRLKEILTYLNTDEYLHEHLALKGYMPSILFSDEQILENIIGHPMAIWKMQLEQNLR